MSDVSHLACFFAPEVEMVCDSTQLREFQRPYFLSVYGGTTFPEGRTACGRWTSDRPAPALRYASGMLGWVQGDDDGSLTLIRPGDNGNYVRETATMAELQRRAGLSSDRLFLLMIMAASSLCKTYTQSVTCARKPANSREKTNNGYRVTSFDKKHIQFMGEGARDALYTTPSVVSISRALVALRVAQAVYKRASVSCQLPRGIVAV
ncbi:hypothetical protein CBL_01417 [Carabus blaptoides fortunei]